MYYILHIQIPVFLFQQDWVNAYVCTWCSQEVERGVGVTSAYHSTSHWFHPSLAVMNRQRKKKKKKLNASTGIFCASTSASRRERLLHQRSSELAIRYAFPHSVTPFLDRSATQQSSLCPCPLFQKLAVRLARTAPEFVQSSPWSPYRLQRCCIPSCIGWRMEDGQLSTRHLSNILLYVQYIIVHYIRICMIVVATHFFVHFSKPFQMPSLVVL